MSVRFSNNNLTYEIPSRYDEESFGFSKIKYLLEESESAEQNIIKYLNDHSVNGKLILSNNDSIKIINKNNKWYQDMSILIIWTKIETDHNFSKYFISEFNKSVLKSIIEHTKNNKKYNIIKVSYSINVNGDDIILYFPKILVKKILMSLPN